MMASSTAPDKKGSTKRNAFTELMNPKCKQPKCTDAETSTATTATTATTITTSSPTATFENIPTKIRSGLSVYIQTPDTFPPSIILAHNPSFVTIHDAYPKSSIHLLILPRSPQKTHLHPFTALNNSDPAFLTSLRAEAATAASLAASELRRRFGRYSAQDQAREAALTANPPPDELPPGRDWSASIMIGVHAVPSMSNLHIHVLSVDRYSDRLKHRKHYNSFSTPFFVPLEDFPLNEADPRRWPGREGYLRREFRCWRCGREFGRDFRGLKEHLRVEFEAWKRE